LKISRGSLSELGYGLHACRRLGYINKQELAGFEEKLRSIGGPLQGLINKRRLQATVTAGASALIAFLAMGL